MRVFLALVALAMSMAPAFADRPPLRRDPFQKPQTRPVQGDLIPITPHPHPIPTPPRTPQDSTATPVGTEPLNATLMGVVNGERRVALVVQHNVVLTVHEGDHIGSARVTAIRKDRVELQNGADHIVMLLHPAAPDQKQNLPCAEVLG